MEYGRLDHNKAGQEAEESQSGAISAEEKGQHGFYILQISNPQNTFRDKTHFEPRLYNIHNIDNKQCIFPHAYIPQLSHWQGQSLMDSGLLKIN